MPPKIDAIPPMSGKTGKPLATPSHPWALLRAGATEDNTAAYTLSSKDLDYSTIIKSPANCEVTDGIIDTYRQFGRTANGIWVICYTDGTDIANDTFDFELFAWKAHSSGPGIKVFSTSSNGCIAGSRTCIKDPVDGGTITAGLWVDTIGLDSGTNWPGGVVVYNSANNDIAVIEFDLGGCRYLHSNVFNAAGGGTEAAKAAIIITAF